MQLPTDKAILRLPVLLLGMLLLGLLLLILLEGQREMMVVKPGERNSAALYEGIAEEYGSSRVVMGENKCFRNKWIFAVLAAGSRSSLASLASRSLAVLAQSGRSCALEPLREGLQRERRDIRLAAAAALGTLGDPRAAAALSAALREEPLEDVRIASVQALAQLGEAGAVPVLINLLDDEFLGVQVAAVEALGALGALGKRETARAVPPLLQRYRQEDTHPAFRKAILRTLPRLEGDARKIYPVVMEALAREDRGIRRAAEDALGNMRGEFLREALLTYQLAHRNPQVREAAVDYLRRGITREDVRAFLYEGVRNQSVPAVQALLYLEDGEAADLLMETLEGDISRYRIAFARNTILALGKLGDERARESLERLARDSDILIRRTAETALEQLSSREGSAGAAPIQQFRQGDLGDKRFLVLSPAERAEAYSEGEILQKTASRNAAVRMAALETLALSGPAARPEPFIKLLGDADPGVRRLAADHLPVSFRRYREIFFLLAALYLLISLFAVVPALVLAGGLGRSLIGWGIFTLLSSFLACLLLPFLPRQNPAVRKSRLGEAYTSEKRCDACGEVVPLDSAAGQRCPHCGAYWGRERKLFSRKKGSLGE